MNVLRYKNIQIGNEYSFFRTLTKKDAQIFSRLSGDSNPLHHDIVYSKDTKFKKPIVHGMLAASLFSTLIGIYCPGKYALYMSQEVKFRKPIYMDTEIEVYGKVLKKVDALRIITLQTLIKDRGSGEILVSGEAMAQVLL